MTQGCGPSMGKSYVQISQGAIVVAVSRLLCRSCFRTRPSRRTLGQIVDRHFNARGQLRNGSQFEFSATRRTEANDFTGKSLLDNSRETAFASSREITFIEGIWQCEPLSSSFVSGSSLRKNVQIRPDHRTLTLAPLLRRAKPTKQENAARSDDECVGAGLGNSNLCYVKLCCKIPNAFRTWL